MTFKYILILLLSITLIRCAQSNDKPLTANNKPQETTVDFSTVSGTEMAHQKTAFMEHEAIEFDIKLNFGGKERLNATMAFTTNSVDGVLEKSNGDKIIVSEDKVFYPASLDNPMSVRFSAYTWSYFFFFPYKLTDPGTHWSENAETTLNGKLYNSKQLTFSENVGDAPDDWYIMFSDPQSGLIDVAAYIVTAGSSQEEAEEDPHAIKYEEYIDVEGIPIASKWTFWAYREDGGLTEQLGDATLTNIRFIDTPHDRFDIPEGHLKN